MQQDIEDEGYVKQSLESRGQPIQVFIETCFPGITDPHLPCAMEDLLSDVQTKYWSSDGAAIRHALLIAHRDPDAKKRGRAWGGSRAAVRLHLANGLLYELHLHGDIESALQRLPQVVKWLQCQPYQVDLFERYEVFLSGLINEGLPCGATCTVELFKYAPIAPPPAVRPRLRKSMVLAALNLLRRDYGLGPLDELPSVVHDYLDATITAANVEIQKYLAGLDQAALRIVRNFQLMYHRRYDDLKVYNFLVAESSQHSRNRIQAIQELPWLLRILSGMDRMHSYDVGETPPSRRTNPRHVDEIVRAIDAGAPLFASVARTFGVPKETVRWTRHRMLPHREGFAVSRMDVLLTMLSWLPPEKRPQTDDDWRSIRIVISALLPVFAALWEGNAVADKLATDVRCGAILVRWLRELTRPTLGAASTRIGRMRQAGDDPDGLKEYVRALLHSLCRFCNDGDENSRQPSDMHRDVLLHWLATQSFHRIMAFSRRWHASMLQHPVQQGASGTGRAELQVANWPSVLPGPVQGEGVTILELSDSVSLVEEGRRMNHCVGGYSGECVMGNALIVSLRASDGRRLSTAEFQIQDDPVRVVLQQHKGYKNTPAPAACEAALNQLDMLLNSAPYQERLARRSAFQKARRRKYEAMREQVPDSVEHYRRVEEYVAWTCTFGPPPAERTAPLRSILP